MRGSQGARGWGDGGSGRKETRRRSAPSEEGISTGRERGQKAGEKSSGFLPFSERASLAVLVWLPSA